MDKALQCLAMNMQVDFSSVDFNHSIALSLFLHLFNTGDSIIIRLIFSHCETKNCKTSKKTYIKTLSQ